MYAGSKKRSIVPFILFVVLCLAILAVYLNEGQSGTIGKVQEFTIDLSAKGQKVIKSMTKPFANLWAVASNFSNLVSENSRLKAEVSVLKKERIKKDQLKEENERLRQLLNFRKKIAYESLPATIIGVALPQATVVIDKGSKDGIKVNMPVVLDDGLIGKVFRVSSKAALVQLIIDPKSSVGAKVKETGDLGIVEGEIGGKLIFKFVDANSKAKQGNSVITSGMGGVFPKDILIGKISETRFDRSSQQLLIEVKPSVNFSYLEQVFVITNPPEPLPEEFSE